MGTARKQKGQTIMIVEGNDFVRDAMKRAFLIEGYYVEAVDSATIALEILKNEPFDLIIADYELPDISGIEFFLHAGLISNGSRKILMTPYGELKTLSDLEKFGIDDAIEKPFPFDRLYNMVKLNLNGLSMYKLFKENKRFNQYKNRMGYGNYA